MRSVALKRPCATYKQSSPSSHHSSSGSFCLRLMTLRHTCYAGLSPLDMGRCPWQIGPSNLRRSNLLRPLTFPFDPPAFLPEFRIARNRGGDPPKKETKQPQTVLHETLVHQLAVCVTLNMSRRYPPCCLPPIRRSLVMKSRGCPAFQGMLLLGQDGAGD